MSLERERWAGVVEVGWGYIGQGRVQRGVLGRYSERERERCKKR